MKTREGYDQSERLSLKGVDGLLQGEQIDIHVGQSVVVGRSRRCDLSLRRSKHFRLSNEAEQRQILAMKSFLKVSRRHVRISFLAKGKVEIWDLSRNGTFVNGKRVDRLLLGEFGDRIVNIRLAESEELALTKFSGNGS